VTPVTPKKTFRSDIPARKSAPASAGQAYPGHPQEEARRLVIGPGIHLQGSVSSCAHMVIEGRYDATLLTAQRLDVLLGGRFSGTAEVHEAVISGHVDGKLTVTGRLLLRPGARVTGELQYGSLQIEPGAQLQGSLAPIGAVRTDIPALATAPSRPQAAPADGNNADAPAVNNVEILFAEPARPAIAPVDADDDDVVARREAPGAFRRYR
jgi:cytoskeletal protein CcmA (bactofilin family)